MEPLFAAFDLVFRWEIIAVILGSCVFGIFAGAMPGISATVAVALLVPITFFMEPVAALAAIATAVAMAIFAGDLPGALLRIPGMPASAAYAEEAHEMTMKGQGGTILMVSLLCSVLGGLVGTLALAFSAPLLADFALEFQYYEYFWLACLGLSTAALVAAKNPVKGMISLSIGLLLATVGLDMISGQPRFTFGTLGLMEGIHFIPVMIGIFAIAEVLRTLIHPPRADARNARVQKIDFREAYRIIWRYKANLARGSLFGTLIGALPGAGSDIAAWVSYGYARKRSKTPEKFGTGHPEGIVAASASNNAATSSTWVPSLVFGIPGDSVTAIVIGVLFLKGLEPGPNVFIENAPLVYSIFVSFFHRQSGPDTGGLCGDPGREPASESVEQHPDADHPDLYACGRVLHQQFHDGCWRRPGRRDRFILHAGKRFSRCAAHSWHGDRHPAGTKLHAGHDCSTG